MKRKYKTLLVAFILVVKAFVIAESPPEPSLRTVCSDSELIIAATAVKECGESLYDPPIKYLCYEFNVDEIYHGEYDKTCIRVAIPVEETYSPNGGIHIDGAYVITGCRIAEKYLLFLKPYKKGYYGRVDEMWAITKYDSQTAEKIKLELADIKAADKLGSQEKKSGGIPEYAQAKVIETDGLNLIARKCEYYFDGKLVGVRGWYKNGQISFEEPLANGQLNGSCKYWNTDGTPHSIENYKNGKLDGIYMYWNECESLSVLYYREGKLNGPSLYLDNDLYLSYWIDGQTVKSSKYIKGMKKDKNLPQVYVD